MTVENIIKAVRWCIDEEALNVAGIADVSAYDFGAGDEGLMNNIIKAKIGDALRWICQYAPAELLSNTETSAAGSIDLIVEETNKTVDTDTNLLTPSSTLLKVVRVKGSKWKRAILGDSLIKEDSDEYLQVSDTNGAEATDDRPQAALINTKQKKVEVWPATGNTFTLTYAKALSATDLGALDTITTVVNVPVLVETSFIYYLAYLVLTAYGDSRRENMLEVAMQNLGKSQKQ
jgi:hypothetical protein